MTRIEIVKIICQSLEEIYDASEHWSDEKQEEYQDEICNLDTVVQSIIKKEDISRLSELKQCMLEVANIEGALLPFRKETIELMVLLVDRVITMNIEEEEWKSDITDIDCYKLTKVQCDDPYVNIFYTNSNDPGNMMCLLDCINLTKLQDDLMDYCNSSEILFRILYCIDMKETYEKIFLVPSDVLEEKINSRIEFIKLDAVLRGRTFLLPQGYSYNPSSLNMKYQDAIEYVQFSEIIDVMNEYNIQENILDKFVRVYQAIENYMYKLQICELCKSRNYSKIGVREFRYLSDVLETQETSALTKFMKHAGDLEIGGIKIKDSICSNWNSALRLDPNSTNKLNIMLSFLGMSTSGINQTNANSLLILFKDMIYKVRCSIVHNKVNENHLSYINLNPDMKWVIEHLMLPNMELLVYELMTNYNDIVMYKSRNLSLY